MKLGTIRNILRPTKIAEFFHHLCDAITDVIFIMRINAILGYDILKKNNVRFDAILIAMRLPILPSLVNS